MQRNFRYKTLFWLTGWIAFFLSAVANNLTTALLVAAVVMAFGSDNPKFVRRCFVNIVIAVNAGGAFSPFGDITTLMVWQAGKVEFSQFFDLFLPSIFNFIIPGLVIHFFLPEGRLPPYCSTEKVILKPGAKRISLLFLVTISIAVVCEQYLYIPPFMGMMIGLSLLMALGYYLKMKHEVEGKFDIFNNVRDSEWDTLLFFFGVVFAVGGLEYIGYLNLASAELYGKLGATGANVTIGVLSAIVDNIPVMFSVLTMNPSMDLYQWQLVTLTAGVGGSLLSVGSAAGVALMGQSNGGYTFMTHLRWLPAILLGYGASIFVHYLVNATKV